MNVHNDKDRSDESHAILDAESRLAKANKVLSVLNKFISTNEKKKVLEIGTGSGFMAKFFGQKLGSTTSVDVVDERRIKSGYIFKKVKNETLPFPDKSFDVVISNHVIEHVSNQSLHVSEVLRVLRSGGLVYLATPNKYWLSDPHYKLPFISYLPRNWANMYLKLTRRGTEWDIYPISDKKLRKLFSGCEIKPIVPELLKNPRDFGLDVWVAITRITSLIPKSFLIIGQKLSPTLIYVFKKTD